MNSAAEYIKNNVSLPDALERYGVEKHKKMYLCPFHSEKTASMSLYDNNKKYHCFGCGADGTVIDFVMQMFDIGFSQAVTKISYDFCLPISSRAPTKHERAKFRQAEIEQQRKRAERDKYIESIQQYYWESFDTWKSLNDIKERYKPKSQDEPLHPNFVKALSLLPDAEYQLECAAERRQEIEQYRYTGMECG